MPIRPNRWWWGLAVPVLGALAAGAFLIDGVPQHVAGGLDAARRALGLAPPAERPIATAPTGDRPGRSGSGPYVFTMTRAGDRLVLAGLLPSDRQESLVEAATQALPGLTLTDETDEAAGAPPGFDAAVPWAARALAGAQTGAVTISDTTVAVRGEAADADSYNAIMAALRELPPGFRLGPADITPPVARPFTWNIRREVDGITLGGHIASEEDRQSLVAAARAAFPDRPVTDRMQTARGLPGSVSFETITAFALTQAQQLHVGTVELADTRLSLRGEAADRDALASITAALKSALPDGLQAGPSKLTAARISPYLFSARRAPGKVVLTGYYPDKAARAAIHQLIRRRFLTEQVIDELRHGDGAPASYLAGVSFGIEQLAQLSAGEAIVRDTTLRVSGEALYEQMAQEMIQKVAGGPLPGWTGTAEVTVRASGESDAEPARRSQP